MRTKLNVIFLALGSLRIVNTLLLLLLNYRHRRHHRHHHHDHHHYHLNHIDPRQASRSTF